MYVSDGFFYEFIGFMKVLSSPLILLKRSIR